MSRMKITKHPNLSGLKTLKTEEFANGEKIVTMQGDIYATAHQRIDDMERDGQSFVLMYPLPNEDEGSSIMSNLPREVVLKLLMGMHEALKSHIEN